MIALKLDQVQVAKLQKMASAICPDYLVRASLQRVNELAEDNALIGKTVTNYYISNGNPKSIEIVNWLEFCLINIVPFVAKIYAEHHIDSTVSWATRMLSQHIAAQIATHNPIDTLYDIWENPGNYAEDM